MPARAFDRKGPLALALVLSLALVVAIPVRASTRRATTRMGRYIVVLERTADARALADAHAARFGFVHSHVYEHALTGYAAVMTSAAATSIGRLGEVRWVQRDRAVRMAAERVPTGVRRIRSRPGAPPPPGRRPGRVDVDVAVLDTGIDLDHADLNVYPVGANCTTMLPLAFPEPNDVLGHGTHVAGSIGALDNDFGVVGVAPGARLWPVKVLFDNGRGFESMVLCGVDYVTARAADVEVANLSLVATGRDDGNCGYSNRDALHTGICRSTDAGITYVVAAGNAHDEARRFVPGAYDEVITVSALADLDGRSGGRAGAGCGDVDDTFADFSNFGPDVDLIAPGACILSTWSSGRYARHSGTSMATAHVSGAAALLLAARPHARPEEIRGRLTLLGRRDWTWPSQDGDRVKEPRVDARRL